MMETEVIVMNGDTLTTTTPPPLPPHSSTDVGDVPPPPAMVNGVAKTNAWTKPQISIEQADMDDVRSPSLVSPPTSGLSVYSEGASTSVGTSLNVNARTHVYPKTPPPNYKFRSPVAKIEKGAPSSRSTDEEEESDEEEGEDEEKMRERNGKSESTTQEETKDLLHVLSASPRSHSLPLGIRMQVKELHRMSSNSDETVDSEGGSPSEKHKHNHVSRLKRQDSNVSDFSLPESSDDSSSDGVGDEGKMFIKSSEAIPSLEQEDDIFIDGETPDVQEQAESKLINWAYNDFVPACHQLLSQCSDSQTRSAQIKSANIQSDLRSLSNTITFFCSEQQQRLSQVFQVRPDTGRGISQSTSTQTFPRPVKNRASGMAGETAGDRSYAVKVLRSASQSLIAPLLVEASQREGFTATLHQAIIKALQKIAWKVEACLSFSNPNHSVEIHAKIFDAQHTEKVREMMIQALPPAEPKLQTAPFSKLSTKKRKSSEPAIATEGSYKVPMRRGQSLKERPEGVIPEEDNLVPELPSVGETEGDDDVWTDAGEVGERRGDAAMTVMKQNESEASDVVRGGGDQSPPKKKGSKENTPNLPRRERIATEGEADLLSKMPLSRQANFGSIPNLDREDSLESLGNEENRSKRGRERYFRPRAFRRTTVSLSKKEVQTLGLTVAKRIDESILDDIQVQRAKEAAVARAKMRQDRRMSEEKQMSRDEDAEEAARGDRETHTPGSVLELQARVRPVSSQHQIDDTHDLEQIGHRLHSRLTKEFDRLRSVSMSDVLDSDAVSLPELCSTPEPSNSDRESEVFSPQPKQRLQLVPIKDMSREKQRLHSDSVLSPSSLPVSPDYERSYTPFRRGTEAQSLSSEWVIVEGEKRKKSSVKGRAKQKVKKSLSNSGKFAHSLLKTARSLRNSSISKSPKLSKSLSAADLLDESAEAIPHQRSFPPIGDNSRLSLSISSTPSSPTPYDARTLPTKSSRMNTLARIMRGRTKDPRSRSFGKSDKYGRGGLLSWHQTDFSSSGSFAESLETVSRNAIHSMAIESEEQLLISVEMATKLQKRQAIRLRASSIGKENPWFQITVNTNIRLFGRQHYIILRPFKEIQELIDSLSSSHGAIDLPRPDKKSGAKKQMKGMEDLLRSIAGNTHLRSNPAFVTFLMPDDQFGSFTENDHSEVSFERLMTFYTPDLPSGLPGSFPSVQMVPPDHVPATPSPSASRKSSLTTGHKKGSMHLMKKDGKEDPSTFVIQEEGEDALIVAHEDDRYVVVAGTFEKLVEQLACEEKPDPRFVTTFLLGYRHFATTLQFLTKLLDRFHMTVPPNATEEEMAYAEKWSYVIQLRVLDILTYWIKKCWPDIYRNPPVLEKVKEFAVSLKATDDHNFQYAGTNIETIITEKMAGSAQYCLPPDRSSAATFTSSHSPTSPAREHLVLPQAAAPAQQNKGKRSPLGSTRSVSSAPASPRRFVTEGGKRISSSGSYGGVDVCTLPAIQLARQLTLIELEFLRAIDIHEIVVFTWDPNTPENKPYRRNLDAFIERFNKVSYWVASEICCVDDARLRGVLLEKFIEVAKHCYECKNYNTTISVLSGLSLAAVRRLKRSWDLVNERTKKWFTKLQPLTSPSTNHRNYRRALASVHRRDPCIPYFGVFMRDVTFFNDGNKKRLKNGLYNFSKLRTMVYKFEELKRYQKSKYFFPPEDKIREFCRNLWCLSEVELYDASLRIEPRVEAPPETDV